ncbi:MAG: methyltransferase domain-containing protein [Promethearchaeota archaeon]
MNLKRLFINKTQREGLLYEIVDYFKFNYEKYINLLKHGHILRKIRIKKYLKKYKIRKLHLGCFYFILEGFLNTDILRGKIPIDITKKLPFRNNTFDLIYSNHVIEHIYQKQFRYFLRESCRILKKGGIQIIQTPSIEKLSKILYGNNELEKQIILDHHSKSSRINATFASNVINNLMHINYQHKYLYDFNLINYLAKLAGYTKVTKLKNNYDVPDEIIKSSLCSRKYDHWDLETETFILEK